jgi:hypothetical protein
VKRFNGHYTYSAIETFLWSLYGVTMCNVSKVIIIALITYVVYYMFQATRASPQPTNRACVTFRAERGFSLIEFHNPNSRNALTPLM